MLRNLRIGIFVITTCLVSNAFALKVSELLVSGSLKKLEEIGFKNPSIVKGKLQTVFKDIYPQGEMTSDKLEAIVANLAKEDAFFKELDKSLKLDSSSVNFKDVEQAYIQSVMLSHIKGKNLVCADACSIGAKATADKVTILDFNDPNLIRIKDMLSSMESTQQKSIVARGLGEAVPAGLGPLEQKQLAFFFLLKKSRSKTQRDFVKAVEKLSLKNGKVDILGSNAKFHKIPSTVSNLSDDELMVYTGIIEMAAAKRELNPALTVEKAFYDSLDDIIQSDAVPAQARKSLALKKAEIKKQNCFFK